MIGPLNTTGYDRATIDPFRPCDELAPVAISALRRQIHRQRNLAMTYAAEARECDRRTADADSIRAGSFHAENACRARRDLAGARILHGKLAVMLAKYARPRLVD